MKKYIILIVPLVLIIFSGCTNHKALNEQSEFPKSQDDEIIQQDELNSEDLNTFIEDYFSLYCDMRLMMNEFWIQYYSPTYRSMIDESGNDIPVMNMIGELMLNKVQIDDFESRLKDLKNNPLADEFKESIRFLGLAYDFQQQYFNGSANLLSFDEFMTGLVQKQLAFAETIKKIQPQIIDEHAAAIDQNENLFSVESVFVYIIEDSCSEAVWEEISKQDGLQKDFSLATEKRPENYEETEAELEADVFIYVPDVSTLTRSDNNAYYVYGDTSPNCSKIIVEAQNVAAGIYDKYELGNYKYGDTSFKYGIREDWNNLDYGVNTYFFTAYCDGGKVVSDYITLNYETYIPPQTNYPSYPSYPSTYSSRTFKGYTCTDDCSGHEAGYEWADDKGINNYDDCSGNSNSFIEGCKAYIDELMEDRDIDIYEIDGDYAYGEDEYGNDVELYITSWDEGDSYGYGEDEHGNELEFYYWD